MGRVKKKPQYDAAKVQKEMMDLVAALYLGSREGDEKNGSHTGTGASLRSIANELDMSVSKIVKLLITGGYYSSDLSEQIANMYDSGKSIHDIQEMLGVSRATVHSYLPYRKGVYNAKETSLNADRIKRYRIRCSARAIA